MRNAYEWENNISLKQEIKIAEIKIQDLTKMIKEKNRVLSISNNFANEETKNNFFSRLEKLSNDLSFWEQKRKSLIKAH